MKLQDFYMASGIPHIKLIKKISKKVLTFAKHCENDKFFHSSMTQHSGHAIQSAS